MCNNSECIGEAMIWKYLFIQDDHQLIGWEWNFGIFLRTDFLLAFFVCHKVSVMAVLWTISEIIIMEIVVFCVEKLLDNLRLNLSKLHLSFYIACLTADVKSWFSFSVSSTKMPVIKICYFSHSWLSCLLNMYEICTSFFIWWYDGLK